MKHAHFISHLDESRILAAIAAAEEKTTGPIRVLVSKRRCADALHAAEKHFKALGLHQTPQRNGVLIFVAPKSHTFAIFGDTGIHAVSPTEFWTDLRDEMTAHLKGSRYGDAILHAIARLTDLLASHFPQPAKDSP